MTDIETEYSTFTNQDLQDEETADCTFGLFQKRLRRLRLDRDLSCPELAKNCDLSGSCINEYENGSCLPTVPSLLKIADFFGVSVDFLLGRSDALRRITNDDYLALENKILEIGAFVEASRQAANRRDNN